MKYCALVLGGYVNGYSIIQELHECGVGDIVLFDYDKRLAAHSNKINSFHLIGKDEKSLRNKLFELRTRYDYIVIFPTDDLHVEILCCLYDEIESFCFLPVHKKNSIVYQDKYQQYSVCEKLDIPYPKTIRIFKIDDLHCLDQLLFPIIIKPVTRKDITSNVFRSAVIENENEIERHKLTIERLIYAGIPFLASEIIPGDGSNIYAYVGYKNKNGKILNEWTGKKLSQFPDDFGVFSSASNEAPIEILEQGRALLNGMDIFGIAEPEFKYDHRDGQYKLMEINLRSMMWHRVGNLSGVHIQYTQWSDALGKKIAKEEQNKKKIIHYAYLKHEIINIVSRKGYYKTFKHSMWDGDKTYFAVFDIHDIRPFLCDIIPILKSIAGQCLRALK